MFLVFQLKAPLASFGSNLAELRLSDTVPRKSAVTGLLAAALGIRRSETERFQVLANSFAMAVGVLREPLKMVDFHTIQAPVDREADSRAAQIAEINAKQTAKGGYKGTVVTYREYLQDGHWVIALQGDKATLDGIAQSLARPIFTLYLGRKSCPLSAFTAPLVVDAQHAEAAIDDWAQMLGMSLPSELSLFWDRQVVCKTEALVKVRTADVRTRLSHNHFASRDVFQGTAVF
jgi:CRISPR system Cascade subunit CasD